MEHAIGCPRSERPSGRRRRFDGADPADETLVPAELAFRGRDDESARHRQRSYGDVPLASRAEYAGSRSGGMSLVRRLCTRRPAAEGDVERFREGHRRAALACRGMSRRVPDNASACALRCLVQLALERLEVGAHLRQQPAGGTEQRRRPLSVARAGSESGETLQAPRDVLLVTRVARERESLSEPARAAS